MKEKIPRITAAKAEKAVIKMGYKIKRQSGSHRIYKNEDGKRITLPIHSNKTIHPKIIRAILTENNLTVAKFKKLIN